MVVFWRLKTNMFSYTWRLLALNVMQQVSALLFCYICCFNQIIDYCNFGYLAINCAALEERRNAVC